MRNEVRPVTSLLGLFYFIIMQELKEQFTGRGQVKGFIFTQKNKSDYGYIYEVNTGYSIHYEVFKHKVNKQFDCVSYPSDKAFGFWAWCCKDYERALTIFEDLAIKAEVRNGKTQGV